MTNKAEYPKVPSELIHQWAMEAPNNGITYYCVQKAVEWALQGAEPVGFIDAGDDEYFAQFYPDRDLIVGTKLYTSPQAPEMPREALEYAAGQLRKRAERVREFIAEQDAGDARVRQDVLAKLEKDERHSAAIESLLSESKGCAGKDV